MYIRRNKDYILIQLCSIVVLPVWVNENFSIERKTLSHKLENNDVMKDFKVKNNIFRDLRIFLQPVNSSSVD